MSRNSSNHNLFNYYVDTSNVLIFFTAVFFCYPYDGVHYLGNESLIFLLYGHYKYFKNKNNNDSVFAFLLFQFFGLLFFSIEKQSPNFLFLTEVPVLIWIFSIYNSNTLGHRNKIKECIRGATLALLVQFAFLEMFLGPKLDEVYFIGLISLSWKIIPLLAFSANLRGFKEKSGKHNMSTTNSFLTGTQNPKENLFYHDIINVTHGLILFLNSKLLLNKKSKLESSDIVSLINEVKTLQLLFNDHFQLKHRNTSKFYKIVKVDNAIERVRVLICSILEQQNTEVSIIEKKETVEYREIYYPSFYRIISNIVKNISDQHSSKAEFHFSITEKGLIVRAKNSIYELNDHKRVTSEKLTEVILDESSKDIKEVKGLGLASIMNLCHEQGANFKFYIDNGNWINEVFFPYIVENEKSAA